MCPSIPRCCRQQILGRRVPPGAAPLSAAGADRQPRWRRSGLRVSLQVAPSPALPGASRRAGAAPVPAGTGSRSQRQWDPGPGKELWAARGRRFQAEPWDTGITGVAGAFPKSRPGLSTRSRAFHCPGTFGASGGPRPGAGEAPPEGRWGPGAVRGVGPGSESGLRLRNAGGEGF